MIKSLEWYPDPGAFPHNTWGAQSSFGRFIIEEVSASDSPAYEARYTPHHLITIKDSLEDAKAAAQADFERRIRSCLTDAPPAVPSEEDDMRAAREAAAQFCEMVDDSETAEGYREGENDDHSQIHVALIALRNSRAGGAA